MSISSDFLSVTAAAGVDFYTVLITATSNANSYNTTHTAPTTV